MNFILQIYLPFITISTEWSYKIFWNDICFLLDSISDFWIELWQCENGFFGDALAMSTFLASVNSSSFPSYNFLFSGKLLIFPDSIWKSDLGQPAWPVFSGLKKSAPFGFLKGGILESGMDEIFSRMRQISLVLLWIARWRGGCAGFFYLIKAAIFPETDIVSGRVHKVV